MASNPQRHITRSRANHGPAQAIGQPHLLICNVKRLPTTSTAPGTETHRATAAITGAACQCQNHMPAGGKKQVPLRESPRWVGVSPAPPASAGRPSATAAQGNQHDHKHQLRGRRTASRVEIAIRPAGGLQWTSPSSCVQFGGRLRGRAFALAATIGGVAAAGVAAAG